MENEILDMPSGDSFESYLSKGETILWRGSPAYHSLLKDEMYYPPGMRLSYLKTMHTLIILFTIIGCVDLFSQSKKSFVFLFVILIFLLSIRPLISLYEKRKTNAVKYLITPKQIIYKFSSKWFNRIEYYPIPYSYIGRVIFIAESDLMKNTGTIHLYPKENQNHFFPKTKNLRDGISRLHPTLELIENGKEIMKLIEQGIYNTK